MYSTQVTNLSQGRHKKKKNPLLSAQQKIKPKFKPTDIKQ